MSAFLVVFFNLATMIVFTALFTMFGVVDHESGLGESIEVALAVAVGAIIFWPLANRIVNSVCDRIDESMFSRLSRAPSLAISGFGLAIATHSEL